MDVANAEITLIVLECYYVMMIVLNDQMIPRYQDVTILPFCLFNLIVEMVGDDTR